MRRRPDVQALRAMAIAAVLGIHLVGRPSGAVLGMDVFFVVSGFLITALLLREFEARGRIALRDFYARRARRILPVAVLVLAVTTVIALPVYGRSELAWVGEHSLASLLFVENWVLVGNHLVDPGAAVPYSPFQHYWSLSVEEQFYLVWPVLLIGLLAVPLRSRGRSVVTGVLCLVIGLSLWSAIAGDELYVTYHSTLDRAWQLGAGALLAGLGWQPRVPAALRALILGAGFAGILLAMLTTRGPGVYPGSPASITVVVLTGAIILFGAGPAPVVGALIGWRPVQYLGDLSYSLYLWNWPIIVLLVEVAGKGRETIMLAGTLILLVSVLSYHLVEQPARRSNWLSRSPRPATSGAAVEPAPVDVREVRDGAGEQAVELRADDRG